MKITTDYFLNEEEIILLKKIYLLKNEPSKVPELANFREKNVVLKTDFFKSLNYPINKQRIAIRFFTALDIAKLSPISMGGTKVQKQIKFNYEKIENLIEKIQRQV